MSLTRSNIFSPLAASNITKTLGQSYQQWGEVFLRKSYRSSKLELVIERGGTPRNWRVCDSLAGGDKGGSDWWPRCWNTKN